MLPDVFYTLLGLSAMVSSMTWTVSKTKIFLPVRKEISRHSKIIGELVECPYCLSHYISSVVVLVSLFYGILPFLFVPMWMGSIFYTLTIVWLAAFQWSILGILWNKLDL